MASDGLQVLLRETSELHQLARDDLSNQRWLHYERYLRAYNKIVRRLSIGDEFGDLRAIPAVSARDKGLRGRPSGAEKEKLAELVRQLANLENRLYRIVDTSTRVTDHGAGQTPPLERKLAAIFYADVAGYSRLMNQDEENTHRALGDCLDTLARTVEVHGGRVVHYAGDAVLADFTTASGALTCAAAVQRELAARDQVLAQAQRIRFRIGLNLGEVIVDREDIYGDGVNIAARLEALADPGGICISGALYDAIAGQLPFAYQPMGEQQLKNIAKPVRAYRVLPEADTVPAPAPRQLRSKFLLVAVLMAVSGAAGWYFFLR